MNRSNIISTIISLIALLVFTILVIVGGVFLSAKGTLFKEFMGLQIYKWFVVLCVISICAILLYVFISIRVKKKKYGDLKYVLNRKDKIKQSIAFILLSIIYIIQVWFFTNGFKKFDSQTTILMCCVAPVPFLVGYFNFEDVGLCEGGVYYYGDIIVWDKLARYSFVGNTLVLAMNKRTFGFNDKYYISFIIKDDDKSEIEEFLCDRI